jgi:hypothetical protein
MKNAIVIQLKEILVYEQLLVEKKLTKIPGLIAEVKNIIFTTLV